MFVGLLVALPRGACDFERYAECQPRALKVSSTRPWGYVCLSRPTHRPLFEPEVVKATDVHLPPDELVPGITVNGASRAYPVWVLNSREIVDDVVGGVPVLAMWCLRCHSAVVFSRNVNGKTYLFSNSRGLYMAALSMDDLETGSFLEADLWRRGSRRARGQKADDAPGRVGIVVRHATVNFGRQDRL